MQLACRIARIFWLKKNAKWSAVRPTRAAAGEPLLVSRFLPTRKKTYNSITLYRATSAKTRATVRQMTEQLHIIRHSRRLVAHELSRH
jgi:uncharacterized cupin superfamily protein